jgi:ribonuclease Z
MDSSPSILLIAPDGSRILIDCGEGCQRSFLEYKERLASVRAVCITHLSARALGGLPGMILTSANSRNQSSAIATATTNAAAASINNNNHSKNDNNDIKNKTGLSLGSLDEQRELDLTLVGPVGMKDFMHALRHFVFCEHFRIQTREGADVCDLEIIGKQQQQQQQQQQQHQQRNSHKIKKQKKGSNDAFMNFFITSLAFDYEQPRRTTHLLVATSANTTTSPSTTSTTTSISSQSQQQTISYLFTTPPIPGKFEIEKATVLGIPKGPLFTQLKAGKTVTFIHPETGQQQLVHSHQVVTPPSPGIAVMVLRYPLSPLFSSSRKANNVDDKKNEHGLLLKRFFQTLNLPDLLRFKNVHLELILHLCTQSDFASDVAVAWRQSLQAFNAGSDGNVDIVDDHGIIQHVLVDTEPKTDLNGSPHLGAAVMAQTRAMLSSDIYLTLSSCTTTLLCTSSSTGRDDEISDEEMMPVVVMESSEKSEIEANNSHVTNGKGSSRSSGHGDDNVVLARPTLEYILLPRSKRGFVPEQVSDKDAEQQEIETAREFANKSGAKALAESVLSECGDGACSPLSSSLEGGNINNNHSTMGKLIFAGTASAIPCKYRNVTGMCLTDAFGRNMLLDIGEGTIGQLLRVYHHHDHDSSKHSLLSSITAVWISHPHADHHLGILRLLEERQHQQQSMAMSMDPVVIIAPPPIFDFLREYSMIVPSIANSYHAIDSGDFLRSRVEDNTDAIATLQSAFQVACCRSVQVQHCPFSYAVILKGTSFGTLVYSGDCRPSHELAMEAHDADVLIHEATFEDGMEAEAALKRHCTVGEALRVAQEMRAKCLVLTHFSQRYPKIPPTPSTSSSIPIIFAFDFMRLTPQNILAASKLTPALRLLYSSDGDDDDIMEATTNGGPSEAEVAISVPGLFAQSNLL